MARKLYTKMTVLNNNDMQAIREIGFMKNCNDAQMVHKS